MVFAVLGPDFKLPHWYFMFFFPQKTCFSALLPNTYIFAFCLSICLIESKYGTVLNLGISFTLPFLIKIHGTETIVSPR